MQRISWTLNVTKLMRWLVFLLPFAIVLPFGLEVGPINIALPDVMVALLAMLSLLVRDRAGTPGQLTVRLDILLVFAMAGAVFTSALLANSVRSDLILLIRFIEAAVLVYAVDKVVVGLRIPPATLFRALKLAGVVGGAFSILQAFTGIGRLFVARNEFNEIRTAGLAHGGAFGAILMTGLLLSIIDLLDQGQSRRSLNVLYIVIIGLGLLFTQTRTWYIAIIAALILYVVLSRSRPVILAAILSPILISGVWVFLTYFGGFNLLFGERGDAVARRFGQVTDLVSGNVEETSLSARFLTWGLGMDRFRESPLFGSGPGALNLQAPGRTDLIFIKSDSQWIDFLAQYGVVGTSLFVLMMAGILLRHLALLRDRNPAIVAYAKVFLVVYVGWITGAFFWSITTGYVLLFFAFTFTVGLRSYRVLRVRPPALQSPAPQPQRAAAPAVVAGRKLVT